MPLQLVFHREADRAECLMRVSGDDRRRMPGTRRGRRDREAGRRVIETTGENGIDRTIRGGVHERGLGGDVGDERLHRLELGQRTTELHAGSGVIDDELENPIHRTRGGQRTDERAPVAELVGGARRNVAPDSADRSTHM